VLPSLRFKEDQGATKNVLITPSLGFGLTYFYKQFAVQLPFYIMAILQQQTGNGR
jgi:hypothetical protein